ncbi:MAG: ribosome-associated translation inhibitor RaiA [Propionibacteriaceae bacterium]|jgi:ribosomal subunit interface protein|nr:ribosome-associated translation inhibitor RaiA [Propionibacteriaceae bacterium]
MEISITGRRIQLDEDFKERVGEKLEAVTRLKNRVDRIEVQVTSHEHHRQPDEAVQVEITLASKGPIIRAAATADEKMAAFDLALDKLKGIVRKAADRRKSHRGLRSHDIITDELASPTPKPDAGPKSDTPAVRNVAGIEVRGDGPLAIREKVFDSVPLTLAQALDEMELVGHDFFLYVDSETAQPSVVYRRHGYEYGVIHLKLG